MLRLVERPRRVPRATPHDRAAPRADFFEFVKNIDNTRVFDDSDVSMDGGG
jgi:hypothetical protein